MRAPALLTLLALAFGSASAFVDEPTGAREQRDETTLDRRSARVQLDVAPVRPMRGHISHRRPRIHHQLARSLSTPLNISSSLERRASKTRSTSKKSIKKSVAKRKKSKKSISKPKKRSKSKSKKKASKAKASKKSKKSKPKKKPSHKPASYSKIPKALSRLATMAAKQRRCEHQLDTKGGSGFVDGGGFSNQHYCGDRAKNPRYVYWSSNMDVDCDGRTLCKEDPSHQSQTAWQWDGKYLDAKQDRYVVINSGAGFIPEHWGLQGLGIVSVVCNGKLIHAALGDTNTQQIGEGSVALAQACFGDGVTAATASPQRVFYMAHVGSAAVPKSLSPSALNALGNKLLSRVL